MPCEYCRLKRLNCVYRSQARTRRRPTIPSQRSNSIWNSARSAPFDSPGGDLDPVGDAVGSPMEEGVYAGVSATYADSPSRTMQLYYGPSSNFSMMQHIHQMFKHKVHAPPTPSGVTEDIDEGLDRFQYHDIFFGKHSDKQDTSYPTMRGAATGVSRNSDDGSLMFLPFSLAQEFLGRFLNTLQKLLPFIDPHGAEEVLGVLYGNLDFRELDVGQRAILLAILAIGATLTEHAAWGETLYKRSRALAQELEDVVNIHVCQLGLLLAHYNIISGNPNLVYLLMGTVVRKMFAAGLHKESLSRGRQSVDFLLVQERRLTFWSIYIFEVTSCYGFGRPISINDSDIGIPYPEDNPFFLLLLSVSRIYARASRELYGTRQCSLFALWKVARGIKADLDAFRAALPAELSIGPNCPGPPPSDDLAVLRAFLNGWFYHAMILTFRPFLIFHAQWQRDHNLSLNDPSQPSATSSVEISGRQLRNRAPWIFEACGYCVSAARELLLCISQAVDSSDVVRRMRYSGFYVEGAAFLLIFNILRDRSDIETDTRHVRLGLQAVEHMVSSEPNRIGLDAIKRMLRLVEGVEEDENAPTTSASSTSPEEVYPIMGPISVCKPRCGLWGCD